MNHRTMGGPPIHPHQHTPQFKTPCRGNYSSRPSFLTERILEDDASYCDTVMLAATSASSSSDSPPSLPQNALDSPLIVGVGTNGDSCDGGGLANGSTNARDIPTRVRFLEQEQPQSQPQDPWWDESNRIGNRQQVPDDPNNQHQLVLNALSQSPRPGSSFITPNAKNATQKQTRVEEEKEQENRDPQDNAMRILQEIAHSLGLSPDNVDAVLPTVRRMVTVVKIHVPRLEHFVESVCEIVEADSGSGGGDNGDNVKENEQENTSEAVRKDELRRQNLKKKMKKKGKKTKNMEARRKRMSKTVMVLKEEWPKRKQINDIDHHDERGNGRQTSSNSSFCQVVIEKLNQRHQRQVAQTIDKVMESTRSNKRGITSSPTNSATDNNTIKDALDSIDELIAFEERCHRIETIQKIVTDSSHSFESSPSSAFSPRSPSNSEDIIEELLAEDATTLRKVVLHFAYLFSVRQDEMRIKMNELYHFSHEAGALINTVRKAMGVDVTCPLSTVSRRVVDAVHAECSQCGSVALPNRFSGSRTVN